MKSHKVCCLSCCGPNKLKIPEGASEEVDTRLYRIGTLAGGEFGEETRLAYQHILCTCGGLPEKDLDGRASADLRICGFHVKSEAFFVTTEGNKKFTKHNLLRKEGLVYVQRMMVPMAEVDRKIDIILIF
jgi:hypothetical protein